jgi:hypothetical protein
MSFFQTRFDTGCTVEVEHGFDSLHAHVELDGNVAIFPGDKILVHGRTIRVPYGERIVEQRRATITRAGALGRLWTRMISPLDITELYEIGFSAGRAL